MAVDVPDWAEFKKYVKQLADEDLKESFNTVTIDTISLAYERCTDYICQREGVDKIGDIPFGGGYGLVDKEFSNTLVKITQMGYGIVFIGHEKVRIVSDDQSTSTKYIVPDLPDRCAKIINRMVDLTAYIGSESGTRYIYPREITYSVNGQTINIFAGSHFANLNDKIELSYEGLVNAIADAMTTNSKGEEIKLTDEKVSVQQTVEVDFNEVLSEIKKIVKILNSADKSEEDTKHMSYYKTTVEKYLGAGKLVKDCTEAQAPHLELIAEDLRQYCKDSNLK